MSQFAEPLIWREPWSARLAVRAVPDRPFWLQLAGRAVLAVAGQASLLAARRDGGCRLAMPGSWC
jgi:hypothetical protein